MAVSDQELTKMIWGVVLGRRSNLQLKGHNDDFLCFSSGLNEQTYGRVRKQKQSLINSSLSAPTKIEELTAGSDE